MTSFEALYGKQCRTPLCQDEIGESKFIGREFVQITANKVKEIRSRLKATQDKQMSYADNQRKDLEFDVGD